MKKWFVAAKKADFNGIAKKYGISPMLARILRNREVILDDEINMYLRGKIEDMHSSSLLPNIEKAVSGISDAVAKSKAICIIGDYDIDGVCATYILKKGFEALSGNVTIRLPDRIKDGYGMNFNMIDEAKDAGIDLIVTCDNGIAAAKEIKYAGSKGIDVIVTDHHEIPFTEVGCEKQYVVPECLAVVDPKLPDSSYPYKEICGGLIAYKVIEALFLYNDYKNSELLDELLIFAAFATVGDVMSLTDENRIVVKYGLEQMRKTHNLGLNALIDVTGIDRKILSPYHLGFVLGPCINASGRLDTALRAIDLFASDSNEQALKIAMELKALNDERKEMTVFYTKQALELIAGDEEYRNSKVLVVYLPDCHESLAGIIAGRIREVYYRPVLVITDSEDVAKGSGRSIEAYDMYEELNKCADLFIKFGGHKMAAGLSIPKESIGELRRRLNANCTLTDNDMIEKVLIDIPMPIAYATYDFANELSLLEPFGVGNPHPLFAEKHLKILSSKVLGKSRNVLKLKLQSSDSVHSIRDAIIFSESADEVQCEMLKANSVAIAYEISINEYMGNKSVQLSVKDYFVE